MNKIALILSAIMLVFGAISTLSAKGLYESKIPGMPGIDPNHPAIYTTFMFLGEFLCLPTYGGLKVVNKCKGKEHTVANGKSRFKIFPHTFLFLVPTCFDLISSQLFSMGNYFSLASVYQVLRNLTVPFVALFSFILFKDYRKRFDLHNGIGLLFILAGAAGTGIVSSLMSNADEAARDPAQGVLYTVLACFFCAGFFFSEEVGLRRVDANPFQGVGIEGMWGLILYAILLPIFNIVKDPFSSTPGAMMADTALWAKMFTSDSLYAGLHIVNIIGVYGFNAAGMTITKFASSSTRVTIDALRTIIVWGVSFAFGWEKWDNVRSPIQIACFLVLFLGVCIYNRVFIKLPYYRQTNKEEHEMIGKKVDDIVISENELEA